MNLVAKRVKDKTVLSLIKSGLKARIFEKERKKIDEYFIPEIGTPQGGILSPLLSNIYLHEIDLFLESLIIKYQGTVDAKHRRKNPLNKKLLLQGRKSFAYRLGIPSRDPFQKEYQNLKFIRYADDFLVGIVGPRTLAEKVRNEIQKFLKEQLKIELSLEKTHITHISRKVPFLGYLYGRKCVITKQRYSGKVVNRRITSHHLTADLRKVIKRFALLKVCDGSGFPLPMFRYLRNPQVETNKRVNRILQGLSE